jgi:5-methylcytosine-specific restriction endonuclease McrA
MLDNEDAMQEIPPISVVFKEYRAYYLRRKKELNEMLKALPLKGSVRRKKIGKSFYYYLQYRSGDKIKSDYVGKSEPVELKKQVEKRRWICQRQKRIDNALYALGIAKRSQSLGLARRFAVFERDNFTCQYCGRNVREHRVVLVVDHVNPAKKGGGESYDNLIAACVECNSGKRASLLKNLI